MEKNDVLKEKFTFLLKNEVANKIQMMDKIQVNSFFKSQFGYELEITTELYSYSYIDDLIKVLKVCDEELYRFFNFMVVENAKNSTKIIEVNDEYVLAFISVNEIKVEHAKELIIIKWTINVEYEAD
jgi:hypothetical protein